jgi:hypothetical protein
VIAASSAIRAIPGAKNARDRDANGKAILRPRARSLLFRYQLL